MHLNKVQFVLKHRKLDLNHHFHVFIHVKLHKLKPEQRLNRQGLEIRV